MAPEVIVTGYKLKKDTGVKIFVTRSQGSADTAHRPVTFVAKSGFTMSSDTLLLSYLQKTAGSRVNENGEVVVRGYALRPDSAKSGKVENIFITSSNDKFILVGAAKGSKPVRITRSPDENYTFFLNGSPVSESALYRLERADISEVTTNVKEEGPTKIEVFTKSGSKPITLQVRNSPRVVTGNGIVFRGDTSRRAYVPALPLPVQIMC
ncbi:hypothetical protein MKQ70_36205 [Chitinophaga sedimenti]|uniref:hypothetical protein n=1 Tax=Chitinophaga sedimenti TaxID=2033606 RepID=UPI0020029FDF|nr:hypothetical protein [Chitinophaga sedimenti]MCK7560074.1 hypothetical protein [Chitinophaga sedimenti]